MKGDPDFEWVRGCLSGDPSLRERCFSRLFEKYKDKVFTTAFRITGDASAAQDVAQETFLSVFEKLHTFHFRAKFSSWLYRIAVNYSIDRARKASKELPRFSEEAGIGSLGAPPRGFEDPKSVDPEKVVHTKEFESRVQEVLGKISEPLRAAVVLRFASGLSYEEIGSVLECPVGTVKSRLNRAMQALEPLLAPLLEDRPR